MRQRSRILTWAIGLMAVLALTGAWNAAAQSEISAQAATGKGEPDIYDVRSFGAVGDGKTLCTQAIQSAIDAATRAGGGVVLVPAGNFVSGTFEMKDNVTLRIASGGAILGSMRREDYRHGRDIPPGNGNVVFISAAGARNFTIEGPGTIDGRGETFYNGHGDGLGPSAPGMPRSSTPPNMDRPHMLIFSKCQNFRVQNIFLTRSGYHTMRILDCENVTLDHIRIYCRVIQNNDGFHFGNSRYVTLSNCEVRCFDDACALFGSNQYVTITNCTFSTRWSVFRFGGGSPDHITVSNCVIYETYGCPIKFGGGNCSNMIFSNLIMRDVTGPIAIMASGGRGSRDSRSSRSGRSGESANAATTQTSVAASDAQTTLPRPGIRNISFDNIEVSVVEAPRPYEDFRDPRTPDRPMIMPSIRPGERRTCITVSADPGGIIENIRFNNIHLTGPGGGTAEEGAMRKISPNNGEYFGIGPRPAYGFYARGVKGLTLDNIRFDTATPDLRPAVILDGVRDAAIDNLSVQGNDKAESALRLVNSEDVLVRGGRLTTPAPVFLSVEGSASRNIKVEGGDTSKATRALAVGGGASAGEVRMRD